MCLRVEKGSSTKEHKTAKVTDVPGRVGVDGHSASFEDDRSQQIPRKVESEVVERSNGRLDGLPGGTHVSDHVAVLADLWRLLSVLERVQQHHLTADRRPGGGESLGQVHQNMPELIDRCG